MYNMVTAHTSIIIAPGLFRTATENNTSLNEYFGENVPSSKVGPLAQHKYRYSIEIGMRYIGTEAEQNLHLLLVSYQLIGITAHPVTW